MYSKELKEHAVECIKKGYKYVTFDNRYTVLRENEPKYEKVVNAGSNDDRHTFGPCIWADMNSKEGDYFGTPDPCTSFLLSTQDRDWQRLFTKSLFEIASDGLTETLVKNIVHKLTLNSIFKVKTVYGHINHVIHSDDDEQDRMYMLYVNVITDDGEKSFIDFSKCSDLDESYLRMMSHNGDASFDITELVNYELANYELSRRSSTDSTKYFTDNELAWILDHAINMGVNNINDCDILILKALTVNPTLDNIVVTLYPSPFASQSFRVERTSRLFQKLDYYSHYYIQRDDLITRLRGKIFYVNKEENHETD